MAIYFFDKNQTLIKIVPESATFEAIQTQELDDDSLLKDTLSVTVKGDEKLLNAEYMAVKSYKGNAQTFDMYRIVTDTTPDKSMSFTGMSLAPYELNGSIVQDFRPDNQTISYTLNRVLDGTDWRVGYIEDGLPNVTTNFYYVSAKEALKELQSLVGCEFVFKVEISGQKITDKWVEVYKEMGNRTKKRFNYGTNALTVVRETNKADIYTALIGRGKGEEVSSAIDNTSGQAGYGRKITFEDVEWSTANGNPLNKPIGQYYLELPQATQAYGIKNIDGTMKARVGIVDFDDEEDKNRLINLTYQQLLVSSRPKVLFKTTVANVGATGIGDTVTIHRHDLNIHYQTRVRKIVRNKLNDNKTQIELGDAVVTPSTKQTKQNNATIKNLNQEIERVKVDVTTSQTSADGKNTIFYGSAVPERQRTGDTWYRPHPSITGETQMLVWNGTAWELVLDTSDLTSVSREVQTAIETAEGAKTLAVSEAESALSQAKADATAKANAVQQQISGEVNTAINTANDAKQTAIDNYNNAVAEAARLDGVQKVAFDTRFGEIEGSVITLNTSVTDADAKAEAIKQGLGLADITLTNQQITDQIKLDYNATKSTAGTALANAKSAMDEAKLADSKIATYVTTNGLVSGTTVDSKIDTAKGEISNKITTVEGKIPTSVGNRNYVQSKVTPYSHYHSLSSSDDGRSFKFTMANTVNLIVFQNSKGNPYDGISDTYTFSTYVLVNGAIPATTPLVRDAITTYSPMGTSEYDTTTGRLVITQKVTSFNWVVHMEIQPNLKASGTVIEFKDANIVRGSKPSDWSPAPEDMQSVAGLDSSITAIYNNTSSETAKAIDKTLSAFTPKDELDKEVATLLTNTSSQTAEKINSKLTAIEGKIPTYVGGRNLIKQSNMAKFASSGTFDSATNTWNLTAQSGASIWGSGISITGKDVIIPNGSWYTISFEVYTPIALDWNVDVNTYPVSGTAWRGNDNDLLEKRSTSSKALEANKWTKCWIKVSATHPNATGDIYDNTNFGLVNNTGSPVSFKIRNVKGELGDVVTDWTPAPEDMATVVKTNEIERTADYSKMAITNLSKNGVVESSSVNATKDGITERVAKVDANGNISYSNRDVKLNSIVTSVADTNYLSQQIQTSSLIQSTITSAVGGIYTAIAMNYNTGNTNGRELWGGVIRPDGSTLVGLELANDRSYILVVIDKNDNVVRTGIYDVYSSADEATRLISHITSYDQSYLIILVGTHAPEVRADLLESTVLNLGGTKANYTDSFAKYGSRGYLLVGRNDLGTGNGFEMFSTEPNGYLKVSIPVHNGSTSLINGTYSQITQLQDNINLRVTKQGLLSQINVQAGGVLIQSGTNKLNVTPTTTYIEDATIKSAMIDTVNVKQLTGITADFTSMVTGALTANTITSTMLNADEAMFTKLFATSMATDKLVAQGAWITDANIVALDAGTITSGTIDSGLIDAKAIVTGGLSANVVEATHIKAEVGLVDKLFSTTAYIEELTNKTIFTEKIQAINISADKITAGTLDASKVKVVNLDAANITTGNLRSINIVNTISYPSDGRTYTGDMAIAGGQISSYVTAGADYYKSIFINDRSIRLSNQDATLDMEAGKITFDGTLTGGGQIWYQDNLARLIAGSYNGFALASYRNGSYSNRLSVGGWPGEALEPFVDIHTTLNMRYNKIENINGLFMKTAEGKTGATMFASSDNNLLLGGTWGTVIGQLGADGKTIYEFLKADSASDRVRFGKNINMQGNTILNQSDERLKHNIYDLERDDLSALKDIRYKNFTFNNQDKETFGFIAQDLQRIMPSLITEETDGYLSYDSMEYTHFIGHALQQHVTKVDDKVEQLEAKIASLQNELAQLKGD